MRHVVASSVPGTNNLRYLPQEPICDPFRLVTGVILMLLIKPSAHRRRCTSVARDASAPGTAAMKPRRSVSTGHAADSQVPANHPSSAGCCGRVSGCCAVLHLLRRIRRRQVTLEQGGDRRDVRVSSPAVTQYPLVTGPMQRPDMRWQHMRNGGTSSHEIQETVSRGLKSAITMVRRAPAKVPGVCFRGNRELARVSTPAG
jgi:hypothetical protein